jgi:hypothetical protein
MKRSCYEDLCFGSAFRTPTSWALTSFISMRGSACRTYTSSYLDFINLMWKQDRQRMLAMLVFSARESRR